MLALAQKEYIKHLYEAEGKPLNKIAKETGLNYRTVKKYAQKYDWSPGGGRKPAPPRYPAMGPCIEIVEGWVKEGQLRPRNQRHTAKKVYERLCGDHNYAGSESSVRKFVRGAKGRTKAAPGGFIPLAHPPGQAQIDFGVFQYTDSLGQAQKGHALVVAFPYSNAGWMQVFPSGNQECLLEGLMRVFERIGGAPQRVLADNMGTAVAKVPKGAGRGLAGGFTRFMLHCRFEAEFCSPASGNGKGSVENKAGYMRRSLLAPAPAIVDFNSFNEGLLERCENGMDRPRYRHTKSIRELWEEEGGHLLALPGQRRGAFRYESYKADKHGFVGIDSCKCGVSPSLSGKIAQAKIYYGKIEPCHAHKLLRGYTRSYSKGSESMDWRGYLGAIAHKPRAAEDARFFGQLPDAYQEPWRQRQKIRPACPQRDCRRRERGNGGQGPWGGDAPWGGRCRQHPGMLPQSGKQAA